MSAWEGLKYDLADAKRLLGEDLTINNRLWAVKWWAGQRAEKNPDGIMARVVGKFQQAKEALQDVRAESLAHGAVTPVQAIGYFASKRVAKISGFYENEEISKTNKVIVSVVGAAAVGAALYAALRFGSMPSPHASAELEHVGLPPKSPVATEVLPPPHSSAPPAPLEITLKADSNPWRAIEALVNNLPQLQTDEQRTLVTDALKDYAVTHNLAGMDMHQLPVGTQFHIPQEVLQAIVDTYGDRKK
jgi:hypothetical protein